MLFVLTPSRCTDIAPQTALSFTANMGELYWKWLRVVGKGVAEARNELAQQVSALANDDDLCLWIDDDCYWPPGAIQLMIDAFTQLKSVDVLTALFGPRVPFATPLCVTRANDPASAPRAGRDYVAGQVIKIASASVNFVLHNGALLRRIGPEPFTPIPGSLGEDHSFFERLRPAGLTAALATGIAVAHCEGDLAFLPGQRPFVVINNELVPYRPDVPDHVIDTWFPSQSNIRSYGRAVDSLRAQFP
jgi:hypothetical protein